MRITTIRLIRVRCAWMKLSIYKRDIKQPNARHWFEKSVELFIKSVVLFSIPVPFAALVTWIWYRYFYLRNNCFEGNMETIITCAWIPVFGIFYGMMASRVLDTVWGEYKDMRRSVKVGTREVIDFVRLRDERVSSLIYVVLYALSAVIVISLMVLKYPCMIGGLFAVSVASYLLVLIIVIIREIDNPCGGLWFIRKIPAKWLRIDAAKFHAKLAEMPIEHHQQVDVLRKLIDECQIK